MCDGARIRSFEASQDFEQRRIAASVRANQSGPFSCFDEKGYIREDLVYGVRFGDVVSSDHGREKIISCRGEGFVCNRGERSINIVRSTNPAPARHALVV